MDSILGFGLALIGIFVFVQAVMLIIVVSRLVKLPLWAPLTLPIQRRTVEDALPVLDTAQPVLEQNGFRYMHTRKARPFIAIDGMPPGFCDVYYHPEHDIHAEVYLAGVPTPTRLCDIYLWNTFVDGTALLTVNNLMHSLIPYPRRVKVADGNAPDLAGQIATHLNARDSITAARTDPADALAIARTMAEQLLPQMEKENQVYRRGARDGEPVYSFRFPAAVKTAWSMRRAAARLKKKGKPATASATASQVPDLVRVAAERIAFARTICMLQGSRAPRWFRRTVFVFSAAAFLALGTWWWGLAGAVTIAAVIVVHEAGHWMAMKLADFRGVQVFFVPGMGGATSGEKHEASPMTHLMVYLAGPVPGLLLALAVFAWVALGPGQTDATWYPLALTGAVAAFFINALNLLPVLPLDGGRVIELFLVGRLPWLRFIFAVGSGGLLLAAGVATGDNVMRAIGIVMLIGSQHHYRIAKASAMLLREKLPRPPEGAGFSVAAKQLHDFLAQPAFQKWTYRTKLAVGQALLPRFLGRLPSWKESALGLTVYVSCALLPLVALLALLLIAPTEMLGAIGQGISGAYRDTGKADQPEQIANAERATKVDMAAMLKASRQQREDNLAAAQGQTQRLAALKEAIEDARELVDYEDAMRLAKLFFAETSTIAAPAREHAEAASLLASTYTLLRVKIQHEKNGSAESPDPLEIDRLQQEAEGILRQRLAAKLEKEDAIMLAQILEARVSRNDNAAMLAMRQEIMPLLAASLDKSDYLLADARRNLARALDRAGQADAAELELRTAVAGVRTSPAGTIQTSGHDIEQDLAWMMIAHRKLDEATRIIAPRFAATSDKPYLVNANQRDAHLAMLMVARLKGDWREARNHAIAIREMKAPEEPRLGNWFVNLLVSRMARPRLDHRATLLLIESERALGHHSAADKLVAEMRKSYSSLTKAPSAKIICRMRVFDTSWRRDDQQALSDIEQRELECSPDPGVVATPATS